MRETNARKMKISGACRSVSRDNICADFSRLPTSNKHVKKKCNEKRRKVILKTKICLAHFILTV